MIDHHPEGVTKLPVEAVIGRIALVAAPFHWESYSPAGKIVRVDKNDFVVVAPVTGRDPETGAKVLTGEFKAEEGRINRRRVRILCDTAEEAQAFVDIGIEASKAFHEAIRRAKERNADLIANGLPSSPKP